MNKCFSCNYFKENKKERKFECTADCLDCENGKIKMSEKPCCKCGFNNKCLYSEIK